MSQSFSLTGWLVLVMNKLRKEFFNKVANLEYYLIGCFRNEYQELFCLFESNKKCDDKIMITGDEFGWEVEELLKSKFLFNKDEIKFIKQFLIFIKNH